MSIHIGAEPGQIAERVLFPGDPLRAKWIAEQFLDGATCHTEVRGMLGYTGTYRGERISVQGSGMGTASASIYATELFADYGVQSLIRVGTCGGMAEQVHVRDVVIATAACTNNGNNRIRFGTGVDFAPTADWALLRAAADVAAARTGEGAGSALHLGPVVSTDDFYPAEPQMLTNLAAHGVLAVEMEASALYTLAAMHRRRALTVLTVSDHVLSGESTPAAERETTFAAMVEIALDAALAVPVR